MRVSVISLNYAPEATGVAPYVSALGRALASRGDDISVVTAMPHYPEWRIRSGYTGFTRREVLDGVAVKRLWHFVPRRPTVARRLMSEVSFGVRAMFTRWGSPDVVILVSPALLATAIVVVRAQILGTTTVLWVQDIYSSGVAETRDQAVDSLLTRVARRVESAVLRRASAVVVIHDRFRDVVERLGVPSNKISVVRNWTHLQERTTAERSAVRARLGWNEEEIVVLHSGAIGRKQDLGNVIAAARLASQTGLSIRFVLMGGGSERARLEREASDLESVSFIDPLPSTEFQDALSSADVLLVNEHVGLRDMAVPSKLTSYFSSGRPVVAATDAASVTATEMEASGGGIRIDPGRPDLIVEAVTSLASSPDRSTRLGAAGLEYQQTVLSEDSAITLFVELLTKLRESP